MRYYTAEGGNSDRLRPMSSDEAVEHYWQVVGEEPELLADLYVDFHEFSQIEFLIFRDRLSSAILISNSAKKAVAELTSKSEAATPTHESNRLPGWEAEFHLGFEVSFDVT